MDVFLFFFADVVLSAFPDTLFTTLTNQQQGNVSTCTSTVGPTGLCSVIWLHVLGFW